MSDPEKVENQLKWTEFKEIGNSIHRPHGKEHRTRLAKYALKLSDSLVENDFIIHLPFQERQIYKNLLAKIACYLDGNIEMIQSTVEKYFLVQHFKEGFDEKQFQISFSSKKSGMQMGLTCIVSNGPLTTRFFIKTHQYGPTDDNPKSLGPPDTKELFIYQFLNHIGIGPEVHFIVPTHGTKITIYIATKDCQLTLLSQLTKETADLKALLQLDLISRILCIRDCTTNSSNCGQVNSKPMIVDFCIETKSAGYVKSDIVEKYYKGNGEFNYVGLMATAVGIPQDQKSLILRDLLQEWNLVEKINEIALEMHPMIQKMVTKVKVDDDLQRYVHDVKETVKILLQVKTEH